MERDGIPIQIFDEDGYEIQRRRASFKKTDLPHGILIKAEGLQDLFTRDEDGFEDAEDEVGAWSSTQFSFFPQAGLRTVGHFQAAGLFSKCYPLINRINNSLFSQEGDPEDDLEEAPQRQRAIWGISSKGYNAIMRQTRGKNMQYHEAQVGPVTRALAGAWTAPASGSPELQSAMAGQEHFSDAMPHDLFNSEVCKESAPRDFILENTYSVDMDAISEQHRTGR